MTSVCFLPVSRIELCYKDYTHGVEGKRLTEELDKMGIDLNHCSWSTTIVQKSIHDMGFCNTAFDEKYKGYYALNIIHDDDGKMERVIVLARR